MVVIHFYLTPKIPNLFLQPLGETSRVLAFCLVHPFRLLDIPFVLFIVILSSSIVPSALMDIAAIVRFLIH